MMMKTKRKDYRKEPRPMPPPSRYIEGAVCPSCETAWLHPEDGRNSYSRFCEHYVCSACGTQEAFRQFFWWLNALKHDISLNEAGQVYVQNERSKR